MTKNLITELTYEINGAAIEVHRSLGPGLLESVYHRCMEFELRSRRVSFKTEMHVPVYYRGFEMETNLRCDLLIENCIVAELKAIEYILPVHEAQLLTYMKLLKIPKGILLNFNTKNIFHEGQKTFVNDLFRLLPE